MPEPPTLQPKPGFEWSRVNWGGPKERVVDCCSYCGRTIPESSVPLMLFSKQGHCAKFCAACQREWWGMEPVDDDIPEDDEEI
jgi:hypothetical protein